MKNIYILGSINMDLVVSSPYMPVSGETLTGSGFYTNPGGKGANQACAAAKLGGNVRMAGCVGDDVFGAAMLKNLASYGVVTDCIRTVEGCSSGIAIIVVIDGDNRIILDAGANARVEKSDVDKLLATAKEGDIFLTQLENPIEIIGYGLMQAKNKGMFTILNPAPANKSIAEYFGYVDMITPNESELRLLTGETDAEKACKKLGVKQIVVTLGGDGYFYYDGKDNFRGKCIKIKPVDTTAAGDTFCGGLAVELAADKDMRNALAFASKAASIACTGKGAQQSIPTRNIVENYKG